MNYEVTPKKKPSRDTYLDYLRGIAVFLMILAHSIHFFHDGTNEILRFWDGVGNTVCFTVFLFVSGAVTTIAYLQDNSDAKQKNKRLIQRTLYMMVGYYILAFVSRFMSLSLPVNIEWLKTIGKVIVLLDVPGFTEFIIPSVFFSFSVLFAKPLYKFISKNIINVLIPSFIAFALGTILFRISVPAPFDAWKALFVGSEGIYRFPIFQYFPIFALGLWWGGKNLSTNSLFKKEQKTFILGTAFFLIFLATYVLSAFLNIPILAPLNRWPPSIGFMAIGLSVVFFLQAIINNIKKLKVLDPVNRFFIYIGEDAFDMFLFSTLIFLIYERLWGQKYDSWQITLTMFFVFMSLSILASSVNSLNSPSLFRKGTDIFKPYQRLFKKRFAILSAAMAVIVFLNLKIPVYSDIAGTMISVKGFDKTPILTEADSIPWWNDEYGQYQEIEIINNESFKSLNKDEIIGIEVDHKNLVDLGLSNENGLDLTIVYFDTDGSYERESLETTVNNPNQTNTEILFKVVNRIFPKSADNRYFLYYEKILTGADRNIFTNPYELNQGELKVSNPNISYDFQFEAEKKHAITTELSKTWIVKGESTDQKIKLTANVNDESINVDRISYYIVNDKSGDEMSELYPLVYEAEIDASDFKPGGYEVYAIVGTKPNVIWSQEARFIVSEPVYVAWTLDWEGYNENTEYLDQIETIANEHDLLFTHFFNPRIYITEGVTEEQREYMTNWVKTRQEQSGDAIGMHLHMHKDMIAAAGVEPKDSPRWGKYKDADGQDVLTTEYSYEELQKIVGWGIERFEENGLGTPKMYRAGGWFADMDLLRVLEENNFWLDSSGRKRDSWWSSFPYWNLASTTQPYLISKEDQNKSTAPNMDLWEFPNNGGDTTAFEASAMIQKFKDNYSEGISDDKKLVTYLSHPRFWQTDRPRMEAILEYLEDYKYENDKGPVIFITLEDAYQIWNE